MDAIFLRGHARTWNFLKDDTIKFFNENFNNPHWYVGIWDTTTVNNDTLSHDFKDSNLIYVNSHINEKELERKFDRMLYSTDLFYKLHQNNYFKIGYLDYHLNIEKKKYELKNNIIYENVHFIRPDILYKITPINIKDFHMKMSPMEVSGIDDNTFRKDGSFTDYSDFYLRAGSVASNIFCSRFFDLDFNYNNLTLHENNPHIKFAFHCNKVKYNNQKNSLVSSYVVRPDYHDYLSGIVETDPIHSNTMKYNVQWSNLLKEKNKSKMIEYMNKHYIDKNDYNNWI